MQRILRRRSDPHEQADEQPTQAFQPPTGQLSAGLPAEQTAPPPSAPSFRDRGRLRRRLRYLRRARELGFRDLGGLVFDLQRFDRDRPDLVQAKLDALAGVDRELRALEIALDQRRQIHELHEPGIASCPQCGALHATDDRFCPACGTATRGSSAVGDPGDGVQHPVGETGTLEAGGANGGAAPAPYGQPAEGDHAAESGRIPQGEPAAEGEHIPQGEPAPEGERIPQGDRAAEGGHAPREAWPFSETEPATESHRPESPHTERPAKRWPGSSL